MEFRATLIVLLVAMLLFLGVSAFFSLSILTILIYVLIFAGLAYSINFITGLTGYVSFGHVVFMGIGAYGLGATVSIYRLQPTIGVLVGSVLGAAFAMAIGMLTLRFRGVYFAISSLVMALSAQLIVLEIPQLGGAQGMILDVGFHPYDLFYAVWAIVLLEIVITYWINAGRLGYGIRAIKSDEDAAKSLGIDASRLKLYVFLLSGMFAGATGAIFAWFTSGVFPSDTFSLLFSLNMLAMIIIGGMGTSIGPLLGASIVSLLSYYFLTVFIGGQYILIGIVVIVMALFFPGGIIGSLRSRYGKLRRVLE